MRNFGKSKTESISGIGSPPTVNQYFPLAGTFITTSFNEIGSNPAATQTHTGLITYHPKVHWQR